MSPARLRDWHGWLVSALMASVGCAASLDETYVRESYVAQRWLAFVQDGKITKAEVLSALGEPTATYADARVLAFRLVLVDGDRPLTLREYRRHLSRWWVANPEQVWPRGEDRQAISAHNTRRAGLARTGELLVIGEGNREARYLDILGREAEYSLVLLFDEGGVLLRHSLRRIKP